MMGAPTNLIYGLIDPRTLLIRYVGLSSQGLSRPKAHRRPSCPDSYCRRWVRSLEQQGLTYEIAVLDVLKEPSELADAERWWIAYGRASGWPLTNITDGGGASGVVYAEKRRRKEAAIAEEQRRIAIDAMGQFYKLKREKHEEEGSFQFFENYRGTKNIRIAVIAALGLKWERANELHAQWLTKKETKTREAKERANKEAREAKDREAEALKLAAEQNAERAREAYERGKRALAKDRETLLTRLDTEKARLGIV